MKKTAIFLSIIAVLSLLSGYLLSSASLIGKAGISLFYKQYTFLKTWWQGALLVFVVLLILFVVQGIVQKKLKRRKSVLVQSLLIVLALVGLYFTYYDFRHTLSHRLLGERFHLGGYLFWLQWIMISIFYLFVKRRPIEIKKNEEERRHIVV